MSGDSVLLFCGVGGQSAQWSLVPDLTDDAIRTVLASGMSFQMVFFTWCEEASSTLERILSQAAQVHAFPFPVPPLLLSLQELALNGVKANMKKAAISSTETVRDGLTLFNQHLGRGARILEALARQMRYWTAIVIKIRPGWMRLDVINASPLLSDEEMRINERLRLARAFDSVECFHKQAGDSLEGAGLGLYLVSLGLQTLDVQRQRLRIRSDRSGHTVARVSLAWGTQPALVP